MVERNTQIEVGASNAAVAKLRDMIIKEPMKYDFKVNIDIDWPDKITFGTGLYKYSYSRSGKIGINRATHLPSAEYITSIGMRENDLRVWLLSNGEMIEEN